MKNYFDAKRIVAVTCLTLWFWSLSLPVTLLSGNDTMNGLLVLQIGWLGPLAAEFGWFGNISLMILLIRMLWARKPTRLDLALAGASVAAAIDAMFWREMYFDSGSKPIQAFGAGYYVWLSAILIPSLWTIWRRFQSKAPKQT